MRFLEADNDKAVKCNPDPTLLRCLLRLGVRFDCASVKEMQTVLNLGASGSDIIYANPCKAAGAIAFAREQGVKMMTFDNLDELDTIKAQSRKAQLIIRIFADDTSAAIALGAKFGAKMKSTKALLLRARTLSLDVIGVSFHIGR